MAKQSKRSQSAGRGFSMRAEAGRAEILLYDVIDPFWGMSAKQFDADLKALGEVSQIDLRINSPGGNITEGMAIYSILKRQTAKVTAYVDGVAASMASVVAMAATEVVMTQGSYLMIHNPLGSVWGGDAEEMRGYADLLDKMKSQIVNIYAKRTGQTPEEISALMDDDTWLTADEAIDAGFADRTAAELAMAASINLTMFSNVPAALKGKDRMSKTTDQGGDTKTPEQVRAELVAQTKDYSDRFGVELAAKWGPLGENKPMLECYAEFVAQIRTGHEAALTAKDTAHAAAIADWQTKLTAAEAKATDAESRLASISLGESSAVSGGDKGEDSKKSKLTQNLGDGLGRFAASVKFKDQAKDTK